MVILFLIVTALTPADSFASPLHPKSISISIQSAAFEGPDSQGAYTVEGTYQASGWDENADHKINIYIVFIDDGGVWPGVYESYSIADKCEVLNQKCVSKNYVDGDTVGTIGIHNDVLVESQFDISMPFGGTFTPPVGAKQMRLYAQYLMLIPGGYWPAFVYDFDLLDPQPVLPPAPTEQATPTPPPTTHTATPEAGPCAIIVSPASATVKAGETVSFSGAAIWSSGVPMSNALLNLDCGNLDGSGCVSPARTDPAGNFSFSYVAPPNTNQASSETIGVSVEGCPVVKSVPINITGASSSQGPGSWTCPSPAIAMALIFGLVMLQTRKHQQPKIHL
jgi:hypothetical protein